MLLKLHLDPGNLKIQTGLRGEICRPALRGSSVGKYQERQQANVMALRGSRVELRANYGGQV